MLSNSFSSQEDPKSYMLSELPGKPHRLFRCSAEPKALYLSMTNGVLVIASMSIYFIPQRDLADELGKTFFETGPETITIKYSPNA